ncbi:MAG: methylenetetrahydrofolate--tRNA-(uracil(54)-C(5))-methyltransferase (FADH(2)-oxidizing) TrmFO [Oligoflexia bacterium]|nr:methylenetetrahydrofolate--tRNA-(uracil(54)-C(5))-methyltransferase (FADH(2)-oxidizing) TrmFO [Oligoflexia bacterium]
MTKSVHIVGAGLAGTECALQLATRGYQVFLYEMRPEKLTPAHKTGGCAELVCSNSLGSLMEPSAPSMLKNEMAELGSFVLAAAHRHKVPAGQALSVDRELFSQDLTNQIDTHPNIKRVAKTVESLDEIGRPAVIATGPLTHDFLAASMRDHFGGDFLYFFDAIAPIIDADSINMDICFKASRYDKGGADYINCPLTKEQYFNLIEEIKKAEVVVPKEFDKTPYFESCLPVEVIVERGPLTLAFGPCKPKGLKDPRTGREAFAIVQLRQENKYATAYNMVGFQTKMKYGEQTRVFRMIPGLEKAEFLKLGSLHRNLFINSPKLLMKTLNSRKDPQLFFAGQITGVEGYFESTCTGMLVSQFVDALNHDRPAPIPPIDSALGALLAAITEPKENFQPTNINWGLFPPMNVPKHDKKIALVARAKQAFSAWKSSLELQ